MGSGVREETAAGAGDAQAVTKSNRDRQAVLAVMTQRLNSRATINSPLVMLARRYKPVRI